MTTTRIDHTGHAHPSTTAARTECRKAMKATPATRTACVVGNGKMVHEAVLGHDGTLIAARCGAGMQRGIRKASALTRVEIAADSTVSCHRCR
jgi:hypothetical protein